MISPAMRSTGADRVMVSIEAFCTCLPVVEPIYSHAPTFAILSYGA
jgi:hypothetical protein